jgi:hypothetical protein
MSALLWTSQGFRGLRFVLSHPFDEKQSKGWGTEVSISDILHSPECDQVMNPLDSARKRT